MAWLAELADGTIIRERDGARWADVDIHAVVRLWLRGHEQRAWARRNDPALVEFIQFRTARVEPGGALRAESQSVGWTDGQWEHLYRVDAATGAGTFEQGPRVHYHPRSRL